MSSNVTLSVPAIADIRSGFGDWLAANKYAVRVATKADCATERTHFYASQKSPAMLRVDGAVHRGIVHQLPTANVCESALILAHDFAKYRASGLFHDVNDSRLDNKRADAKYYATSVDVANAITRELSRRAYFKNNESFSADLLLRGKATGDVFRGDLLASQSRGGLVAAFQNAARFTHVRDCLQQILCDFAIYGGILVPQENGKPRGAALLWRVNEAWLDTLATAATVNGAICGDDRLS